MWKEIKKFSFAFGYMRIWFDFGKPTKKRKKKFWVFVFETRNSRGQEEQN
jgi:hypothetical protein